MANRLYEPVNVEDMNLSYYCRGCHQQVRGVPITDAKYRNGSISENEAWIICKCPTHLCELSFVIYDKLNERIRRVYPFSTFDPASYHEAIPEKIREDLAEADRCYHADAYKGAVTMNRRAVQRLVLDKVKIPGIEKKKLWEQIDALFDAGFITKQLKDTAHEIRHFGNFGAHPSDDLLDNTSVEDAERVDRLTMDLIRIIYIVPYETDQLKKKRNGQ
ncbi:hypothetical protein A2862_03315 [Candidatus Roizmanbacteria bacterium RIFCSPHIGHO2_01_FULL_38_41]|nr:MAG: hypothetical protein A2862_03315 [Candidatus Roizmanbacteria bacterium RIFCSPHIGHO2_01_FULL_38_41]OGK33124.1 MAG: hypothetical protein A3E10_00965 [Candidatus Roizmanbacteria bacterium RIFCSPHIGHO2_12_FULL_37_23]OGK45301.1 MAG: hypothetical protein A2956_02275 [Candidatus Roizmanbacteria bacterium RIFCSPLOWO2_01_FULL_37_57]